MGVRSLVDAVALWSLQAGDLDGVSTARNAIIHQLSKIDTRVSDDTMTLADRLIARLRRTNAKPPDGRRTGSGRHHRSEFA